MSFGPTLGLVFFFSLGVWRCVGIFFCGPRSTILCSLFPVKDHGAASLTHMSRHSIQNSHQQTIPMCGCCFVLERHQNACLFVRCQATTLPAHFQCGPLQSTVPRRYLLTLVFRKWFQHRGLCLTLPSSPPSLQLDSWGPTLCSVLVWEWFPPFVALMRFKKELVFGVSSHLLFRGKKISCMASLCPTFGWDGRLSPCIWFFFLAPLWTHVLHFKEAFVSWERLLDLTKLCFENSRMASDQKKACFSVWLCDTLHTILGESLSPNGQELWCHSLMLSNYGCLHHCVGLRSNRAVVAGLSPLNDRDDCYNLLYSMKWSSLHREELLSQRVTFDPFF